MAKQQERKGNQTHAVSLITLVDPSSPISEQYRTIRTNIQFASSADQQIKTLVVTLRDQEKANRLHLRT